MNCVSGGASKNLLIEQKEVVFFLLSTSCLDRFMLAHMMMSSTLVLQTTFQWKIMM